MTPSPMASILYFIKRLISHLPERYQQNLKRKYYSIKIRIGKFNTDEKEYLLLDSFISHGDWVLDIGANIGHYTAKFSELVGKEGRVISIEPVPSTFKLLVSNSDYFKYSNVTLLNFCASDISRIVNMEVPTFETGLKNFYQANITEKKTDITSMSIPIDAIPIPHSIKLVKIDTEGHELFVIRGMHQLLLRDYPILIIEASSSIIIEHLMGIGYSMDRLEGSPNYIFQYNKK